MGQRGTRMARLVLSDSERDTLERWARRHTSAQALALRCLRRGWLEHRGR